jgi:membrane fusion protein, multidrug efflux system
MMKLKYTNTSVSLVKGFSIFALLGFVFIGCGEEEKAEVEKETVTKVIVQKLEPQKFENWKSYAAELKGRYDAVLVSAAGGTVASISQSGKKVFKGTSLCSVDASIYAATSKQAKLALQLTKSEFDRTKANVEAGSVGSDLLIKAEMDVASAKVAVNQASDVYKKSLCSAPFNGQVVARYVEKYQMVGPGTPILRIAEIKKLQAKLAIPEKEGILVKKGQKVEFSLSTGDGEIIEGQVIEIDQAVNSKNRVFSARVQLENSKKIMKPGMIGSVKILVETDLQALLLPEQALLRSGKKTFVYVVENNKAVAKDVNAELLGSGKVRILKGIELGENIVIAGAFKLSQGVQVKF